MRGRLASRQGPDQGFSMVEMLVVTVLLGVVGAIVSTTVIQAMKTAAVQQDQAVTLTAAKVAMERVTREVRGANAMITCQPRLMSFTYTTSTVRTAFSYSVDAVSATSSELRQVKTVTQLATGTATTTTTSVLGGLAIGRAEAVFTYADASGAILTPTTLTPETYSPGATKTVGIKILLRRIKNRASIQLYQLVSLRNFEV